MIKKIGNVTEGWSVGFLLAGLWSLLYDQHRLWVQFPFELFMNVCYSGSTLVPVLRRLSPQHRFRPTKIFRIPTPAPSPLPCDYIALPILYNLILSINVFVCEL